MLRSFDMQENFPDDVNDAKLFSNFNFVSAAIRWSARGGISSNEREKQLSVNLVTVLPIFALYYYFLFQLIS